MIAIFSTEMLSTLSFLKATIPSYMNKMTPEEICLEYQTTKNDKCVAAIFDKLFGQINNIIVNPKYCRPNLDNEQKISETLDMIAESMELFDCNGKIKFITFFTNCLKRKMYAVTKPYDYSKRKITFTDLVSLDTPIFENSNKSDDNKRCVSDCVSDTNTDSEYSEIDTLMFINSIDLSKIQKKIVSLLYNGYSVSDISNIINIDTAIVRKEKNNIKKALIKAGVYGG